MDSNILVIGFLVVVGLILLVGAFAGMSGLVQSMGMIVWGVVALALIGTILAVIYILFFMPKPTNVNKLAKQQLMESAKLTRKGVPVLTHGIYLSGDKHASGCRLGRITGYSQTEFRFTRGANQKIRKIGDKEEIVQTGGKECFGIEHEFVFKPDTRPGWSLPFFGTKEDVICVIDWVEVREKETEEGNILEPLGDWHYSHSPLVGDVTLNGSSLRQIGEYKYLGSQFMDTDTIDSLRHIEAQRISAHLLANELYEAAKAGIKANAHHLMEKELTKQVPVAVPMQGQQPIG